MSKGKRAASRMALTANDIGNIDKRINQQTAIRTEAQRQIAKIESVVRGDQELMEKVRENGVKLGFHTPRKPDGTLTDTVRARMQTVFHRWTVALSRPISMPKVRHDMITHMLYELSFGGGALPLEPITPEHDFTMYFATADFAALFTEMQRDFTSEQVTDYVSDILEEWGPHGQIVIGFDNQRVPQIRVDRVYNESQFDVLHPSPPDPGVVNAEGQPWALFALAAMVFQWRTDEEGITEMFAGMRSIGDTFRTSLLSSMSMRDAILLVWMLASKQLRMLESTTRPATAGVPPRAKKDQPKRGRDDDVTVVTLRRHVRAQVEQVQRSEESTRHLTHRFVVRGHWRNQAYGTNRALRRRTYILPFVKGPQDAPFIDREKVYQW